jgi:hypothetical protein
MPPKIVPVTSISKCEGKKAEQDEEKFEKGEIKAKKGLVLQ